MKSTNTRRASWAVVALATMFVYGCSDDKPTEPKPASNAPSLRLLNLGYDNPAFDMRVSGALVSTATTYCNSSGYKQAKAHGDQQNVSVHMVGDTTARLSSKNDLGPNSTFSVFVFGPQSSLSATIQYDNISTGASESRVRYVNASNDAPRLQVRLFEQSNVLLGPANYTGFTDYVSLAPGETYFTLENETNTSWFKDYDAVNLEPGVSYTMVLHGTMDTTDNIPLSMRLFRDDATGSGYADMPVAPRVGKVSFVHAYAGGAPISVSMDNQTGFVTDLAYGKGSTFASLSAGEHVASVLVAGTDIIKDNRITVGMRKSQTFFVTGALGQNAVPVVLNDVTKPNGTMALVRIANFMADTGSVDVYTAANTASVAGADGLAFRDVSRSGTAGTAFLEMLPAGSTTLTFRDHATQSVLVETTPLTLQAGKIYTVWIGGQRSDGTLKAYILNHN